MVLSVESGEQAGRRSFLNRQGFSSGLAGPLRAPAAENHGSAVVITGNNEWVISMWARQGGPTMTLLAPAWTQTAAAWGAISSECRKMLTLISAFVHDTCLKE